MAGIGVTALSAVQAATPAPTVSYHRPEVSRYQTPEDVFDAIPVVSAIPRRFLFTGGYTVKLTVTEMRIDHMATQSRCPISHRNCTISLAFAQAVGNRAFSSRFDMPLLSSEAIQSPWSHASLGDYVLHLSNTPVSGSSLRLLASARF